MLLEVKGLTIPMRVKKPLSFKLNEGELLNIIGPTGSGKTSILMAIAQLIKYKGIIKLRDVDLNKFQRRELAKKIGFVLDEVEKQFVAYKVADEIAFTLENLSYDKSEIVKKVSQILKLFNLENLMWRRIDTLSAGEKVKVALASALVSDPDLLLIDNVFSHIDPPTFKEFTRYLNNLTKFGKGIIITSYEKIEDSNYILLDGKSEPKDYELPAHEIGGNILEVENIYYGYLKGFPILRGVYFEIRRGEITALLGRNGVGKTTLAKIIAGLIKPHSGYIRLSKIKRIIYVPENPEVFFVKPTPLEDVSLSINISDYKGDAMSVLKELGISDYANMPIYSLSKGIKKLVSLAISLALNPEIVIIDEPTTGLDPYYKFIIAKVLSRLSLKGTSIVLITHDIEFAKRIADRFLILRDGKITYDGEPKEGVII